VEGYLQGGEMNVVYTALFGNYDTLLPPLVIDPEWEYVVFTNIAFDAPAPWQVLVDRQPHPDPRKASRYYFDQSCLVLPEAEYTVMHGANAQLNCSPTSLLSFLGKNDIAAFKHPHRDSVYDEEQAVIALNKDVSENTVLQMERYREEGFPGTLLSACILLVRHNTLALDEFEEAWWNEVQTGSCRDQLSFDYCRWRLSMGVSYIPGDPFACEFFRVNAHQ
jgi:hypothetical protein